MCVQPRSGSQVPELTVKVVRASSPHGTTAMAIRDRLNGPWRDEDFVEWYPRDGKPGLSPAQLATVSVLSAERHSRRTAIAVPGGPGRAPCGAPCPRPRGPAPSRAVNSGPFIQADDAGGGRSAGFGVMDQIGDAPVGAEAVAPLLFHLGRRPRPGPHAAQVPCCSRAAAAERNELGSGVLVPCSRRRIFWAARSCKTVPSGRTFTVRWHCSMLSACAAGRRRSDGASPGRRHGAGRCWRGWGTVRRPRC